jgi:hypothetical protein
MRYERPHGILSLTLAAAVALAGAPLGAETPFAAHTPAGFDRVVVFGSESVTLGPAVKVLSGDVVVNGVPADGVSLRLGAGTTTPKGFAVLASWVDIGPRAAVGGRLVCNKLTVDGRPATTPPATLRLPVFRELPPFRLAAPGAGPRDVVVGSGETVSLPPGRYLDLAIGTGGRVLLRGGLYHFLSVKGEARSALLFTAPSEVRISNRLSLGPESSLAPARPGALRAAAAVVYVADRNGSAETSLPAVSLGARSLLAATVYAPGGTLSLGPRTRSTGALVAKQLSVGSGSTLALDSGFRDDPPPDAPPVTAEPQIVFTDGGEPLKIVLTGASNERGDLEFAIASSPRKGTLEGPKPIVPEPFFDPDRQETVQPPVRSAVVVYTPESRENLWDSFVFQATNPKGETAKAEVTVNPPPGDDLPPSEHVDALDGAFATRVDTPVLLTLRGNAPVDVALDFEIAGEPRFGTLGKLIPGDEKPRRTAQVEYLPESGHLGPDAFAFTACGLVRGVRECDRAAATVDTRPDPEAALRPAYDQELATLRGTPVEVRLTGNPRSREEKLAFTVVELPRRGQLADAKGNPIRETPFRLAEGLLTYVPDKEFVGDDTFLFAGEDGLGSVIAKVSLRVVLGSCADSLAFCDDGRGK